MSNSAYCPFSDLQEVLTGKWSLPVLCGLTLGPRRYGRLREQMPGLSPKVLNSALSELEELGYIRRKVEVNRPLHVEYSLTQSGKDLLKALHFLIGHYPPRHSTGRQAKHRMKCSSCEFSQYT